MRLRAIGVCILVVCLVSPCLADKIAFKDGTVKTVRIYKKSKEYVSYLYKGKIEVVPLSKIKDLPKGKKAIKYSNTPMTDKEKKELAAALKARREELKKKLKEEEKNNGVESTKTTQVTSLTKDPKNPGKGVKIISKGKSKTKATELMIDPFPDHPVKPKKKSTTGAKTVDKDKEPATKTVNK